MLECYQAYAASTDMAVLTEALVAHCARVATGTTTVTVDGQELDLAPPWPRRPMLDLIREHTGESVHPAQPAADLAAICDRLGVPHDPNCGRGKLVRAVHVNTVEPHLTGPWSLTRYPRRVLPLPRRRPDRPPLPQPLEPVVLARA